MFRMVALMPEGASQHLARTPELAFPANHLVHAIQLGQQRNEMVPDQRQSFEWIGGELVFVFRKWITDPLLVKPFRSADVLENPADRPELAWIGLGEFLRAQAFDNIQQIR